MGHSLPEDLDPESAGPFWRNYRFDPLLKHKIQATHHVGDWYWWFGSYRH